MPLRYDFTYEHDNEAELILEDLEFNDNDTPEETELKFEIISLYNEKLDERIRRKKFVIDNALVDVQKI